jgi:plastocyanin
MRSALVIARIASLIALAACQNYGPTTAGGGGGPNIGGGGGGGGGKNATVTVTDNKYTPAAVVVDSGSTVTWIWSGVNAHSVTFDGAGPVGGGNSGVQLTGTFTALFTTPGTYPYHCLVHGTAMTGVVTVQ